MTALVQVTFVLIWLMAIVYVTNQGLSILKRFVDGRTAHQIAALLFLVQFFQWAAYCIA